MSYNSRRYSRLQFQRGNSTPCNAFQDIDLCIVSVGNQVPHVKGVPCRPNQTQLDMHQRGARLRCVSRSLGHFLEKSFRGHRPIVRLHAACTEVMTEQERGC